MNWLARINRFLSFRLTPAAKKIFVVNIAVFLALTIASQFLSPRKMDTIVGLLAADPDTSLYKPWTLFTYMFVHEMGLHLLFNMMVLWFFAPELEARWGTSRFWRFYICTGAGAALLHAGYAAISGGDNASVIGASGALFGVLLAFGAYYPYRTVYLWGVLPILMKWFIPLIIVMELVLLPGIGDGVSHFTHLAGLAVAFFYLAKYHRTSDIRRWRYLR